MMKMMEPPMRGSIDPSASDWKARAAKRRRKLWTALAVLGVFGFIAGYLSGYYESDVPITKGGTLPPNVAIIIATLMGLSLSVGSWFYFRMTDELDQQNHLKAATVGAYVGMTGYPVWFILARGGWLGEPSAFILFAVTMTVYMVIYYWKKYVG